MKPALDENYWNNRYLNNEFGWDIGHISTPLKNYFDQLSNKELKILIPGAGNSYEAEYLFNHGFQQVYVCDLAIEPLSNLKKRCSDFPDEHLLHTNFFDLDKKFDIIIEQTFFCAIDPALRPAYAEKANELLQAGGKLVGLLFDDVLNDNTPPFGGSKKEYETIFKNYFLFKTLEPCFNSIEPRKGRELFINFVKEGA